MSGVFRELRPFVMVFVALAGLVAAMWWYGPGANLDHSTYRDHKRRVLDEVENTLAVKYSSHRNYRRLAAYRSLVDLGKPIVPYLIEDIRGGESTFHFQALRDLLPEVDLQALGDEPGYGVYASVTARLWLRWWDEYGRHQDWS